VAESEIKSFTSKKRRGSERQTGHTHARANTATQENRKRKNTKHSRRYNITRSDPSRAIGRSLRAPRGASPVTSPVALGARRPRARCQTSARGRALPSAVGAAWRASSLACTHRDTRRGRRLNEVCRLAPLLALVAAPLPEASLSPVKHSLPNYSPQRAPWSARMGYLWREGGEGCSTPPGRVAALLLTDWAVEV
jgi:hypothetical protein